MLGVLTTAVGTRADGPDELAERLRKATAVLSEMASGKQDTDIPREVLTKARAVAVIVGGRHGQGVMSVKRISDGRWSAPAFESLLKGETTLGGDVSVTAGPKSIHDAANTDGTFKAEIFSYARSTGFFAGASFEGANVQPDGKAIRTLYGDKADSRDVLLGGRYAVPTSARAFVSVLTTYSPPPKKRSEPTR